MKEYHNGMGKKEMSKSGGGTRRRPSAASSSSTAQAIARSLTGYQGTTKPV